MKKKRWGSIGMKKLKGIIVGFFSALLIITIVLPAAAAEVIVTLDGAQVEFDVPPQIIDGRTMVPLRAIFEALGADVDWDPETHTVTATRDETIVIMQIGNNVITVSGNEITLDVPPMIVDGRTLVPVRAVAESFGIEIFWDPDTWTVYIGRRPAAGEGGTSLWAIAPPVSYHNAGAAGDTAVMYGEPVQNAWRFNPDWMGETYTRHNLNGQFQTLRATVGRQTGVAARNIIVAFMGDGRELYRLELGIRQPPRDVVIDVSGVEQLTIRVIQAGIVLVANAVVE